MFVWVHNISVLKFLKLFFINFTWLTFILMNMIKTLWNYFA